MVDAIWLVPVVVLVAGVAAWLGPKFNPRIDRLVRRLARAAFERFVPENTERDRRLQAAFVEESYEAYAAKSYFYAILAFFAGSATGAMVMAGLLVVFEPIVRTLSGLPNTIARPLGFRRDFVLQLSADTRVAIIVGGALVTGLLLAVTAYVMRWKLPQSNAAVRHRSIDEGLPRTTAFMYALSRGGYEFPAILRALGQNQAVFGEAATEMSVAIREMDLFGRDMITAVRRMARRSPSDQFKNFGENLASVLQSGSDLPTFLREQYDRFQAEAEERQAEVIELLATIAEGYVTALVAGVLFLMTILLVFGLTTTDTLWALQMMAYLIIPLANAAFIVFLAGQLESLDVGRESGSAVLDDMKTPTPSASVPERDGRRADGGLAVAARARRQLSRYDRLKGLKSAFKDPIRSVLWNPMRMLYVTVPIALLAFAVRFPTALQGESVSVRVLDDLVLQSALFVLITYAVVREIYKRRIDRIEAAMPDFLERLASLNEAGMTVTEGVGRARGGDLGVLTPEVERIYRDVQFGGNIGDAFVRFGRRVRTMAVTRVVVLLTHALRASGQVGDVLRIAASQARADIRMRRQRRRQMLTYLVVIYLAFVVFLVIIFAVNEVLIPSLPESVPTPGAGEANRLGVNVDQFARFGSVDKAAYSLVFFHTALVQALFSGFIGGQFGEGNLKDGAKHAAALVAIAYVAFILLSSPVASVAAGDAVSTGERMEVSSVSVSSGGFVVAYADGVNSTQLGQSEYLAPGTHSEVPLELEQPVRQNRTVTVVTHLDTDGDQQFSYQAPYDPSGSQVDRPYPTMADSGVAGVEVSVQYDGN
jgi:flagellar protein FlaJ